MYLLYDSFETNGAATAQIMTDISVATPDYDFVIPIKWGVSVDYVSMLIEATGLTKSSTAKLEVDLVSMWTNQQSTDETLGRWAFRGAADDIALSAPGVRSILGDITGSLDESHGWSRSDTADGQVLPAGGNAIKIRWTSTNFTAGAVIMSLQLWSQSDPHIKP